MKRKLGKLLMVLGAGLILSSLGLFLYNRIEANNAKKSVQVLMPQIIEQIQQNQAEQTQLPETETTEPSIEVIPTLPAPVDPTMTEVAINGYGYIGYLSIPKLGLELPVMADWDYPRLKISPCRYTGSTKTDDLVIMAHNYAHHFGTLANLSEGDSVQFVDMDGDIRVYRVVAIDILPPTAVEEVTSGECALTLFTCTYGGKTRVTVYCDRVGH